MHTHRLFAVIVGMTVSALPCQAQQQLAAASSATEAVIDATLPPEASNTYWEVSTGFDHSRGTYGALTPTTIAFVPFGAAYHTAGWTLSVDSGFVHIKGPLDYIDITDLLNGRGGPPMPPRSIQGIGDTVFGVKYAVFEDTANGWYIDLGGRLRTPTASRSKGLGTGHFASDLQVDVLKVLGPWSIFANAGYSIRDGRDVDRNPWSGSLGVGRALTEKLSAGTFYQWRQSVRRGGPAAHEVFAYTSYRLTERFALTLYGATGFSAESIDREIGVRYSYRWP